MNWGNRLLLVFIAFAGLMSYMVYRCMQVPVELVAKEYYRDELVYQNVIDGTKKANALSKNISIYREADKIVIEFPPEMKNNLIRGNILFYCTADEKKDRKLELNTDTGGKQELNIHSFAPGHYIVKINWQANNNEYYSEQPFTVL